MCKVFIMPVFTLAVKYPVRYLVTTYRWRDHAWHLWRVAEHEFEPAVLEFYSTWHTHAEKRHQSRAQRQALLRIRKAA